MPSTIDVQKYSRTMIAFHWAMFLLIVGVFAAMELRDLYPRGSAERDIIKSWHYTLGLTVFFLVLARLAVRLTSPKPAIVPPLPAWQRVASQTFHVLLYMFMIAMPIGGWLILSGEGKSIPFWFGTHLPALIGPDKELAEVVEDVHKTVANIGYALIGLHAAAALFHHYFRRDNTLERILP